MRESQEIPQLASPLHHGVVFEPAAREIQLIVQFVDYHGSGLELATDATDAPACLAV